MRAPLLTCLALAATTVLVAGCDGTPGRAGPAAQSTAPTARATAPTTPLLRTPSGQAAPVGWTLVSALGAEVEVPTAWLGTQALCSTAPSVLLPRGATPAVACQPPVSAVEITRAGLRPLTDQPLDQEAVELDGHAGTSTTHLLGHGLVRVAVLVPDRHVEITATDADPAVVERVVGSIRIIDTDLNGCSTALPDRPSWDRRGARTGVGVGSPVTVGVCLYEDDGTHRGTFVMAASTTLTGSAARDAGRALDAARPGPAADAAATACLPGTPEDTPVVLHVHHTDGDDLEVRVRFSSCADRWVASPHGISHVTPAQLAALLGQLRYGYGWTDVPTH